MQSLVIGQSLAFCAIGAYGFHAEPVSLIRPTSSLVSLWTSQDHRGGR